MTTNTDPPHHEDGSARGTPKGKLAQTIQELRWLLNFGRAPSSAAVAPSDQHVGKSPPGPLLKWFYQALQTARVLLSAVSVVMILLLCITLSIYFVPGASVLAFGIAVGLLVVSALLNAPPLHRRLPRSLKPASWFFLFVGTVGFLAAASTMQSIYSRTPAGVRQAAEYQEQAKADAARMLQGVREGRAQADRGRAESCLSRGRRSLAQTVKESLENPRSFEFVDITIATVTDEEAVVFMTFRGENGFGATRTEAVRAVMDTSDCSISQIGEPRSE